MQNVEQLIFYDKQAQRLLPELADLFCNWLGNKSARLEFINMITQAQLDKLSSHFGSPVSVQKLDYHLVNNAAVHVNELEDYLNSSESKNVSIGRNGEQVYLSSWK